MLPTITGNPCGLQGDIDTAMLGGTDNADSQMDAGGRAGITANSF